MKRTVLPLTASLLLLVAMALSCSESSKEDTTVYTPEDSKQILEDTSLEVVKSVDADDFSKTFKALDELSCKVDSSNTDSLEGWVADLLDQMTGITESIDTLSSGIVHHIDYSSLYRLAPFTGRFTLGSDLKWTRTDENYLTFVVPTASGIVTANLTISEKVSTVRVAAWEDYLQNEWSEDYEGKDTEGNPVYTQVAHREIVNGYANVDVPETVNLTFLLDEEEICVLGLSASLHTPAALFYNDELDINAALSATGSITQGIRIGEYSFDITKFSVDGDNLVLSAAYTKGKTRVVSAEVGINSYHVDASSGTAGAKTVTLSSDLLGKVQFSGTVDFDELAVLEDTEVSDEAAMRELCDKINSHIDIGLYFGSKTKQAALAFTVVSYEDENGASCELIPVIDFTRGDGGEGGIFALDEYFNEQDFSKVITAWENLLESFSKILPEEE